MASLGQTLKLPKTYGKRLYKRTRVVLYKRRLEKTANTRKIGRFGKLEKWPLWKGYSLCKIASLGQSLKLPKTCGKPLYKYIRVVLCKKRSSKKANIRKIRPIGNLAKNGLYAKAIAFAKWQVWVKHWNCQKHTQNNCAITLQLFYAKNRSKKHLIFEKWDDFENWKNGHYPKAIAFAKWSVCVKK